MQATEMPKEKDTASKAVDTSVVEPAKVNGEQAGGIPNQQPQKLALTATPSATIPPGEKQPESKTVPAQPATTPPTSKPVTAPASTSTNRATNTSAAKLIAPKATPKAASKKKRKRKGLSGLLLALGCLSTKEFEEEKSQRSAPVGTSKAMPEAIKDTKADAAISKGQNGTAAKDDTKVTTKAEIPSYVADATGNTTLVGETAGEVDKGTIEEVIVAPAEPHTLPVEETAGVTSSAVQPPGGGPVLLGTPSKHVSHRESDINTNVGTSSNTADPTDTSGGYTDISNSDVVDDSTGQGGDELGDDYLEYDDEEDRLIAQGGMGIPLDENGQPTPLLPPLAAKHRGRKCLVLDLDETLLHSSFKQLPTADYIVPVEIESQVHNVYVVKRPGVDQFLADMAKHYEIVVFTASLSKYADPVLDMLDTNRVVAHRLFRESCYNHKGNYVKDLSQLGRDIHTSIIIDNSPASYIFHPNNAVPISTWFSDPHDSELTDLCPFLADLASVEDVRDVLDGRV
ncbi:uncharacterized protein L203_101608 [Cryptococcus depauperatus CBS 7841]|uniref:FCP1 homology domain-containing protein n=1 Tax=Cryptococcus depauperatus CBS 7841 TaxID=1295531 RepID=A0AAJ8JQA4_9TREE